MSDTEWSELTTAQRRETLLFGETTMYVDDLRHVFLRPDCGGDVNVYVLPLEDDEDGYSFASLGPDEVRRLHAALGERIAQYRVSP